MTQNAYDRFFAEVEDAMEPLTDAQALLPALCAMERLWQLYLDWTRQDSAYCLQVKPETLRQPARELLDLLWERVEAGEALAWQKDTYDRFLQQVEDSYDDEDGQDVDFGNANLLLEALRDYGGIFFPFWGNPLRQDIVYCATSYLYRYYFDGLTDRIWRDLGRVPPEEENRLLEEYAAGDPVWLAECARVRRDLKAARRYPYSQGWFRRRRKEYSALRLLPIYSSRDGEGNPCIKF